MSDIRSLAEAREVEAKRTPGEWRDHLVPTSCGRCHKILDPATPDKSDHGSIACIYDDDTTLQPRPSAEHAANAAAIALYTHPVYGWANLARAVERLADKIECPCPVYYASNCAESVEYDLEECQGRVIAWALGDDK